MIDSIPIGKVLSMLSQLNICQNALVGGGTRMVARMKNGEDGGRGLMQDVVILFPINGVLPKNCPPLLFQGKQFRIHTDFT